VTETFRESLRVLASAQKGAARSAPAYSRFVNRRLGRVFAAVALRCGLTANQVTALSATATFAGILLVALVAPGWWLAVAVCALLVVGYALDSADGQVARATNSGSPAGEWLDHMVDAAKISTMPLAVAVALYRFTDLAHAWLLVPLVTAVVGAVYFFGMILTEQIRRAHGVVSSAAAGTSGTLRSLLVLPTDYGVLCLAFILWAMPRVFFVVYGLITLATLGAAVLAARKWYREIRRLG
jgi:phosphatidylglycerophosphate synthase